MLDAEEKEEVLSLDEGADDEDEEIINRISQYLASKYQFVVTKYHNVSLLVSSNHLVNEIRNIGLKQVVVNQIAGVRQMEYETFCRLLPLFFLVLLALLACLPSFSTLASASGATESVDPATQCSVESICLNDWWWSSRVMDSCPELIKQYPTILYSIFLLSSYVIQLVVWLAILLSPYLWYLALSNHWEDFIKRDKATFSAKRTLLFNTILVSFLLASDLHLLLGYYFGDTALWQFPVESPLGSGVFPSGHVVAAGALTFLYPSLVPYTLTLILSRLLMGYHTALQCLISYAIGVFMVQKISQIICRREFILVSSLATLFNMLVKFRVTPVLWFVPLILVWFPVTIQYLEPY